MISIKNQNYTVRPAYITSDWTAPNTILLEDTVIMTLIPSQLTEDQLFQKLPQSMRQHVLKIFLFHEKGIAVLIVPDKSALERVLQLEGNFTIDNKEPELSAANLVLYFTEESLNDDISSSRFQDNEELRYSLRSIERFAPWVQHIYIVTNGQIPYWLNLENPRVSIVTHEDIYPNKSHLPTFSSPSIETHLHRIPGLTRKFLYINDDVVFGKEIWPEDFYTQAKGHKVYLSWSVPECHEGCPSSWIKDGYCDKPCNNSDCQWDGGDCKDGVAGMMFNPNFHPNFQAWKEDTEKMYCMPNCANMWIADRYCDQACNSYACGFDAGDCGVENYNKLKEIELTEANHLYTFPKGTAVAYFNLTTFLGSDGSVTDGSYEDSPIVRAVAINQKFKIITIILHSNHSATILIFTIKGTKQNYEYQFQFNVTADTSDISSVIDNHTAVTENHEGTEKVQNITVRQSEETTVFFEEFAEHLRYPQIKIDSKENEEASRYGILNTTAVELPKSISNLLKELEARYKNGELTDKGFRKKKSKLIENYLQSLRRANVSLPLLIYEDSGKTVATLKISHPSESTPFVIEPKSHVDHSISVNGSETMRRLQSLPSDVYCVEKSPSRRFLGDFDAERGDARSDDKGSFPWEKKEVFASLIEQLEKKKSYHLTQYKNRRLLDTFGDSLRHVNRLFNQEFGYEPRKVPAHMPHLVDVEIINQLQERFAKEFDVTSSNKIRSTTDMQFAFSFFYFLMNEKEPFDIEKIFDEFDTDFSGTWSDREIRTILARVHDLPITYDAVVNFENAIANCSKHLPASLAEGITVPPFERYLNSKLPIVSKDLVKHCDPIVSLLLSKFKSRKQHLYEIVGEEEVAFKMIQTNTSQVIAQLDDIRKNPRKFICLNDNIEHHKEGAALVKAVLIDFYESFFPIPSQFELPKEYRNRFLHVRELREWQRYRSAVRRLTYVCLSILVLVSFVTLFRSQISAIWRRLRLRKTFLRFSRTKKNLENV